MRSLPVAFAACALLTVSACGGDSVTSTSTLPNNAAQYQHQLIGVAVHLHVAMQHIKYGLING